MSPCSSLLTLDARRCMNQRRGFELPICADPLSKVTSIVQPYCQPLSRYSDRKDTEGTSCAHCEIEQNAVIEEPLILWLYDDMLAGVRRSRTYSCLAIIGHEVKRQSVYGRVTSFTSSSDGPCGPCDHWHLTETQAKALSGTRVLPREDRYGCPTPDSLPRWDRRLDFNVLAICHRRSVAFSYGCR
jgi:hypothetical protein